MMTMPGRKSILIYGLGDIGRTTLEKLLPDLSNTDFYIANRDPQKVLQEPSRLQFELAASNTHNRIIPITDLTEAANVDVIIVASGVRAGTILKRMTDQGLSPVTPDRNLALEENVRMIIEIGERIVHAMEHRDPKKGDPLSIIVANPNDVVTNVYRYVTNMEAIAIGNALDTGRWRTFLWQALQNEGHGFSYDDIQGFVFGPHSNYMTPSASTTLVRGKPLSNYLPEHVIQKAITDTIEAGPKLVENYVGNGGASPTAFAISQMVASYLQQISHSRYRVFAGGVAVGPESDWMDGILSESDVPIVTGVPFDFWENEVRVLDRPGQFLRGAHAKVVLSEEECRRFQDAVRINIPFQHKGLAIYAQYLLNHSAFESNDRSWSISVGQGNLLSISPAVSDEGNDYRLHRLERVIHGITGQSPLQCSNGAEEKLYYRADPSLLAMLGETGLLNLTSPKETPVTVCR